MAAHETGDETERSYMRGCDGVVVRAWQWNGTRLMHLTGGLDGRFFMNASPGDWVVTEPDARGVFNRYREDPATFRDDYTEIQP